MQDSDTWPLPAYNPGSRDHLHALGVISIMFAGLQASVDSLYSRYASIAGHSLAQIETDYFAHSEEDRVKIAKALVRRLDEDKDFISAFENAFDFFNWCRRARNIILHSERYPPAFGGKRDELHMVKWTKAPPRKPQYVKFTVAQLRGIADNFRIGVIQSAELSMHLRYRGTPIARVPDAYKPFAPKPPRPLKIPHALKATDKPQS
jgi:hypothetical protein